MKGGCASQSSQNMETTLRSFFFPRMPLSCIKPCHYCACIQVLCTRAHFFLVSHVYARTCYYNQPRTRFSKQVGRVRANDVFGEHGLDFFVCGDQLLRGAALNAVLIAEALVASSVADPVAA